jgi:beta-lactamase class A
MKNYIPKNIIKFLTPEIIISYLVLLCLGVLLGFYFSNSTFGFNREQDTELRITSGHGFTSPLLECEVGRDSIASKKLDFSPELEDFSQDIKEIEGLKNISIYYRDLNNGPVININANESFAPASLLKVPILIAYLKWSEDKPEVLDEQIKFDTEVNVGYTQEFAPVIPLELGKTYSAKQLLESMIKYSDNQSLVLLYQRLPASYQQDLYSLTGVDTNIMTDPKSTLTIRQYSIFFRILFNASFLSQTNSEYALKLLSESTFEQGVRKGVPLSIPISHKFGERKPVDSLQQFHDCGVVYYPDHPYLLCVMTRGEDVSKLIDSIYKTSEFVYNKIDSQYGSN